MRTFFGVVCTVGLLWVGASSAFAAKGVKKNATHEIHGIVVHVHHHQGKLANGHIGSITVKTHHKKKKAGAAGKKTHEFSVGTNTQFYLVHGTQHAPGNFAEVHDGEHVTIKEKDGHAESVAIHVHKIKAKKGKKR
jgi:hypothetical protein